MRKKPYSYEADWRQYAFPPQVSGFATDEALEEKYTPVLLEKGIPLKKISFPDR